MELKITQTIGDTIEITKNVMTVNIADYELGLAQMLEAEQSNTRTATGNITLTDTDTVIQLIDPGGSDRDVTLPAESNDNHGFLIFNTANADEDLVIKNDAGTEIATVYQGGAGWFVSNGSSWESAGLGTFNPTSYAPAHIVEGRISCHATEAVPTSDVVDATKIYLHRFKGKWIALYDTTLADWERQAIPETPPELTITSLTASKNRDVFVYMNSGTMTLETVEWTNDTTRVALAYQDGVLVMSGSPEKLYLCSIRIDSAQKCQDTLLKRFCINYYNQVERPLQVKDATASWSYNGVWRQMRATTTNKAEFIVGISKRPIEAINTIVAESTNGRDAQIGIGLDAVNALDSDSSIGRNYPTVATIRIDLTAKYRGYPGIGYHYLAPIEREILGANVVFYGGVYQLFTGIVYG